MGSDDLFKKRREARKKRSHEFKTPKANSYLIVTEGECTEPYYFNGLKKRNETYTVDSNGKYISLDAVGSDYK